jgi:hypothetical protein
MTKNQGLLLGIALILLFTGIALATSTTSSATSHVIIYAFDQNPAGSDAGNEWVTFHNPSNKSVDIGNWTFESTHGTTAIDWIPEGTTPLPRSLLYIHPSLSVTGICSINGGKIPNLKHQITNKFKYLNVKQTMQNVCFEDWDLSISY